MKEYMPPLVAQLLYNRGITEKEQIKSFLDIDTTLNNDPFLMPDMEKAVERVYQAILSGEKIVVYGDFDVDGITGTTILVEGLAYLGNRPEPYIPHRVDEGHGLRKEVLQDFRERGFSLVLTVDCGITDYDEIAWAQENGLDVVLTDHHTPPESLPPAVALVNPKLSYSLYPFVELAGVGVAFKLLQALFSRIGKNTYPELLIDLVAMGTVSDVMPLVGENRYLVQQGLQLMNASPRLGIQKMLTRSGNHAVTTDTIVWTIAPRLNAAGRLEHALSGYKLLITESNSEAEELANWLEEKNTERQRITADIQCQARSQILKKGITPILMAGGPEFPAGINGLVASRLTEEFYRPAVVMETGETETNASCRSIKEFNMIQSLTRCKDLFTRFGGHAMAAGFSLPTSKVPELEDRLLEIASEKLAGLELRPHLNIDAEVRLRSLGGRTFQMIQRMQPFGSGNPLPTFMSRNVEILDCHTMGSDGQHLRLKVRQNGTIWNAVAFGWGECEPEMEQWMDIVYHVEVDNWNGAERLRLNLIDFSGQD